MNPEFLPEMALLLAGVFAGVVALRLLFTRQLSRGVGLGAAGIACIVLAFVLGRSHRVHSAYSAHSASSGRPMHERPKSLVLVPATKHSVEKSSESPPSMSLVLGDVLLRVAPSDRYVLSVDDEQFLVLDSLKTGLIVSCTVGARDRATTISRSLFPFYPDGVEPSRPDAHTLLVQEKGKDIFRVNYAEPRKIEVTGQFVALKFAEPALISFQKGIRWKGGGIPPGASIDLRPQGKGRIDFERSGLIRVLPH